VELIWPRLGPDDCVEIDAVDLDSLYGAPRHRVGGRPWVGVCMITSLDGSTVVEGRSGGLGNHGDRAVFSALRRAADVVLVGATTAAAEHYRPARRDGQRIGVVTRRGNVDVTSELFASGSGFLVMPEDGPQFDGVDSVRAGRGTVDFAAALVQIGAWPSAPSFVQCEGGPTVNGALNTAGCIDELDLTIAPMLTGGDGPRLTADGADVRSDLQLAHVVTDHDGYLFTRWVRATT
jgi:riboflavin biosynthesis pyrimidine reductase